MRTLTLLSILMLFSPPASSAAEPSPAAAPSAALPAVEPVLGHVRGRAQRPLDGVWRYMLDPMETVLRKGKARRNFFEDARAVPGGPLIEYDWDHAPTIRVPSDWNSRSPELLWYEGRLWYHHRFEAARPAADRRVFLYFEAVNYRAIVYLNGRELGENEGGFLPFAFEVTDVLRDGLNRLVLAVDNRHGDETIPARDFDWWNYGGITRPVRLVEVPATYLHDYRVVYRAGGGARAAAVEIEVEVRGPERAGAAVRVEIDGVGRASARADAEGRARLTVDGRAVVPWTPEAPRLYGVRITAAADSVSEELGLRTVQVRGREILLNGHPIYLRGISIHEEALGAPTRTLDADSAAALLGLAKDLGCNFVRLAHYPHDERMTRLADRLGLLVWSEVPIYWEDIAYHSPRTLALAERMVDAMIARDRNRASVIVWSVANETPMNDPDRTQFLRHLIERVRSRDATRLVSAALNKQPERGGVIVVEDPLGAHLDLLAVNQYEGWYGRRTPAEIPGLTFATPYEKPMIFSEFGAGALKSHHGGKEERWTEEYQAHLYEKTLEMAEGISFLRGMSPWILKDFRSPRRYHGRFQQYWNRKGLVSESGARKQAFEVLRAYYRDKARAVEADR